MYLIECRNLCKSFDDNIVLRDIKSLKSERVK